MSRTARGFVFIISTAVRMALLVPASVQAATIVVSNTNDSVNGCVTSPDCLIASPGADGISMREAITAANATPGPHTITFAPSLAGQTISPTSDYPNITQSGITISGLVDGSGQPTVNVDAHGVQFLFSVRASGFTLTSVKIVNLLTSNPADRWGVQVLAGQLSSGFGNQRVSDIVIRNNVFANPSSAPSGLPLSIGTDPGATGALLTNVTIADNTFLHMTGLTTSIRIAADGNSNTIQDVAVTGNTLSDVTWAVELTTGLTNNRILRTRIVGNIIESGAQTIIFDPVSDHGATTGCLIDDTLIARNVFRNNVGPAILIFGGLKNSPSDPPASNNVVSNVRIVNNLVTGSTQYGAVGLGGGSGGATNNTLTNVTMVNNTFANNPGIVSAVNMAADGNGSTGNTISNVSIVNTIFRNNAPDDLFGFTPSQVRNSIVAQSGFAGVNGNINVDPKFVSSTDPHLQAGSPAIGAGLHVGAPFGDLDCRTRPNPPSIGAYEPGGNSTCLDVAPVASVLPASRSVQVGNAATAFAAIINTGSATAKACGLVPAANVSGPFTFRTTNPATNQVTGTADTPVDIPAGGLQTYVFGFTAAAPYGPADTAIQFTCGNTYDSPTVAGLDTLLFSASASAVPDIVALGATTSGDGIVTIPGSDGTGAFAVASVNVGTAASITVKSNTGSASLPLALTLCQTNPATGQCISAIGASVTTSIAANATPTFAIFAKASGAISFVPQSNRIFVEFDDSSGTVRGSTSVAVRTQ